MIQYNNPDSPKCNVPKCDDPKCDDPKCNNSNSTKCDVPKCAECMCCKQILPITNFSGSQNRKHPSERTCMICIKQILQNSKQKDNNPEQKARKQEQKARKREAVKKFLNDPQRQKDKFNHLTSEVKSMININFDEYANFMKTFKCLSRYTLTNINTYTSFHKYIRDLTVYSWLLDWGIKNDIISYDIIIKPNGDVLRIPIGTQITDDLLNRPNPDDFQVIIF